MNENKSILKRIGQGYSNESLYQKLITKTSILWVSAKLQFAKTPISNGGIIDCDETFLAQNLHWSDQTAPLTEFYNMLALRKHLAYCYWLL